MGCGSLLALCLSSPGLTGRSSNHRPTGVTGLPGQAGQCHRQSQLVRKSAYVSANERDPCGRSGLRTPSTNKATTRVALHHYAPAPFMLADAGDYQAASRSSSCKTAAPISAVPTTFAPSDL